MKDSEQKVRKKKFENAIINLYFDNTDDRVGNFNTSYSCGRIYSCG